MEGIDFSTVHPGWAVAFIGLMVLHQVLNMASKKLGEWWDHRKGNGLQGSIKTLTEAVRSLEGKVADNPPYPPCHYDPQHFERIKFVEVSVAEILAMTQEQQREIDRGRFSCRIREEHLRMIERRDGA